MEATQACGYDIPGLSPALKEWVLLCQQQQDNQRIALQQQMDNQRMAWARQARRRQRAWEKEMEELEQSPTPTISASKSPPMTVPGPSKTAPAPAENEATKPVQEVAKPAQETAKPAQGVARPTKEAAKPALGRGQFGHVGKKSIKVGEKCRVIALHPSQVVYQICLVNLLKSAKVSLKSVKLLSELAVVYQQKVLTHCLPSASSHRVYKIAKSLSVQKTAKSLSFVHHKLSTQICITSSLKAVKPRCCSGPNKIVLTHGFSSSKLCKVTAKATQCRPTLAPDPVLPQDPMSDSSPKPAPDLPPVPDLPPDPNVPPDPGHTVKTNKRRTGQR